MQSLTKAFVALVAWWKRIPGDPWLKIIITIIVVAVAWSWIRGRL